MQISLALSVVRCRAGCPASTDLILRGQLSEAVKVGTQRLNRLQISGGAMERALLGQMLGRTLIALGREQEAQEILQEMRKVYDTVSKQWVRWFASLDQGWTFLGQNRAGRAIECFRSVIDDPDVPADIAIETLNCMADALHSLGESRRGMICIEAALERCYRAGLSEIAELVDCHRLELLVMQAARQSNELSDHVLATSYRERADSVPDPSSLRRELVEREQSLECAELVTQRLHHLQLMLTCLAGGGTSPKFTEVLAWLKERRLAGLESNARIDSAMALLAANSPRAASEALGTLVHTEAQTRQSRYAMDLHYCMSKLYQVQGQMNDSIRAYKQHVEQAVYVIRRDYSQAATLSSSLSPSPASSETAETADAARLRLPLKYRCAYQFIVENITDNALSVKHVAAHAGVTERSLQLAFRAHLGMTPAEFIRKRRMECIRGELQSTGSIGAKVSVLDVAARWGVRNRSTLAQNYRQIYAETPFETLHGKTRMTGSEK
ncbi:MAG: helix-turn-helix transcriptional regulator [Burkholderiales bacterium]|jgi:AraC-like DNA-binding protein|nr:helix-turn-helix transcriptional regulator [Burkholderiales bacterium]